MSLSANAHVVVKEVPATYYMDYIVKSGVTVYQGALLAIEASSGHVIRCVAKTTPPHRFAGIATEYVVGDGVKTCRVQVSGVFQFALGSAAITDIGAPVYASADDTLTLTVGAPNICVLVGAIVQYVTTDTVLIAIAPRSFSTAAYA